MPSRSTQVSKATSERTSNALEWENTAFLKSAVLLKERVPSFDAYPFNLPAVRELGTLHFHPCVTFFAGENGSGKSTLIEAIAIAVGFNAEGGSKNFRFSTHRTESELHHALRLIRGIRRERDGFFVRAESLYNLATEVEALDGLGAGRLQEYGDRILHNQSHGEALLALVVNRFRGEGLYILDEPEAALSPSRQLALLKLIDVHVRERRSQFIIATHSPILLAYPDALIYYLTPEGVSPIAYEETEHFKVTSDFLSNRQRYFHHLFDRESAP